MMALKLEIEVLVETALPPGLDASTIERLIEPVLQAEGADGAWQVTVVLADDARLHALHRDFLGVDTPTDVMTFPLSDPGEIGAVQGGDIVVSVERAAAQGPEYGLTPAEEILFVVTHGLLHLCGWDDTTDTDRAAMLQRQTELLAELNLIPQDSADTESEFPKA